MRPTSSILADPLGPRVGLCYSYLVSQVSQISIFMLCAISIKPQFLYILIRASDRWDFRDKFKEKLADFRGIFVANFAKKQSVSLRSRRKGVESKKEKKRNARYKRAHFLHFAPYFNYSSYHFNGQLELGLRFSA